MLLLAKGAIGTNMQLVGKVNIGRAVDLGQTYLLVDEAGNEIPAVLVDTDVVLTATANDIRTGMVAATETGLTVGTKDIPAHHTTEGIRRIPVGRELSIPLPGNKYEYTKLQALICDYNTSLKNSVSTFMVAIDNKTYDVRSIVEKSSVISDHESRSINFGLVNSGDKPCVIRYITYREEE